MQTTEVQRPARLARGSAIPTLEALRSWDWRDELDRQERSFGWLARHTDRSASAVARYASGTLPTPDDWLIAAARQLDVELGFEAAA